MAHGLNTVIKRGVATCKGEGKGIGSRRIFAPHFKLQVLDSYRNDADCKGNQRATARKYGIHRRQIQKWLQVENTLRSTVGAKEKSESLETSTLNAARQLDGERRVPSPPWPESAPLDFTTHGRAQCPPSPSPMDLSCKRPSSPACRTPLYPPTVASPCLALPLRPQPDVWDLSTKSLKRKCDSPSSQTSPKPVKLFKPYLDDMGSSEDSPVKLESILPCCSAGTREIFYYNNNIGDKPEYNTYTLLELQPKSALSYYYSSYPNYSCGDYETGTNCVYEDISYGQSVAPLKQRQSYSLDFKLSAIDCYYQDNACKGNQRAVATKYNVHRRQVQKWLKQAEELRSRNETVKQTHAVR